MLAALLFESVEDGIERLSRVTYVTEQQSLVSGDRRPLDRRCKG